MRMAAALLLSCSIGWMAQAAALADHSSPRVMLEGGEISFPQPPMLEKGSLLVPVRALLEAFGATAAWDQESKEILITQGERRFKMELASGILRRSEGEAIRMGNRLKVINGTAYAPLRELSEAFGMRVSWNSSKQTAVLHEAVFDEAELARIQEQLFDAFAEIQEEHNIVILSGDISDRLMRVKFRKYGVHDKPLSEEELEGIKNSFYRAAGIRFPLHLDQLVISAEPDFEGVIEEIRWKQMLIIHPEMKIDVGGEVYPEAVWITLTEDAAVEGAGVIKAGRRAKAWFAGLMLTSYPGQAMAIKIEVIP